MRGSGNIQWCLFLLFLLNCRFLKLDRIILFRSLSRLISFIRWSWTRGKGLFAKRLLHRIKKKNSSSY